jgi:hypothetical protein
MSRLTHRKVGAIGALAGTLALLPAAVAGADTPPTGLLPSQVNPVQQTLDGIERTPAVNQVLVLYSNLAGGGGGAVWGTLNLTQQLQIPRSPVDSTPIQLVPDYNQLVNSSTSATTGAAAQGTGRLEVVGTRVARDGRSARVKVSCVGAGACDGVLRLMRPGVHKAPVVWAKHVRLAAGATKKYTLRG